MSIVWGTRMLDILDVSTVDSVLIFRWVLSWYWQFHCQYYDNQSPEDGSRVYTKCKSQNRRCSIIMFLYCKPVGEELYVDARFRCCPPQLCLFLCYWRRVLAVNWCCILPPPLFTKALRFNERSRYHHFFCTWAFIFVLSGKWNATQIKMYTDFNDSNGKPSLCYRWTRSYEVQVHRNFWAKSWPNPIHLAHDEIMLWKSS